MAVAAVVLVTTGGHARHVASAPLPSAPPLLPLLDGVPAHGAHSDLILGGEDFWRADRQPRAVVAAGFLFNGISPLLPRGHGARVDQLAPVPGGVVAHISDISAGSTYGALGHVVFIPAATAPARVIARATMIAVGPGGRQVWVQLPSVRADGKGVQRVSGADLGCRPGRPPGQPGAAPAARPGRRHRIRAADAESPHRAAAAAERRDRPADPLEPARGRDFRGGGPLKVISWSCGGFCQLNVTDLTTGTDTAVELPRTWVPPSQTYPPPAPSFDPSGRAARFPA